MSLSPRALFLQYSSHYRGLSADCWRGIGVNFVDSIFSTVFYFLTFYLVHDLKFKIATAGVIISCYGVGTIIGAYGSGRLADRLSPKLISMTALCLQALAYLLLVFIHSLAGLMAVFLLMGIATYGFMTANTTWVVGACRADNEAEKLKAMNLINVIGNLGFGLAAITIGLCARFGFNRIFVISGIVLLTFACYTWISQRKSALTPAAPSSAAETVTPTAPMHNRLVLWTALLCLFLIGAVVAQLGSTYTVYVEQTFPTFGLSGPSILLVINAAMVVFLQAPLVNRFHNAKPLKLVGISSLIIGGGMMILSFASHFSWAIVSCVIYTFGEMVFFSMVQLICYQSAATGHKGKSLGLYRTTYAITRVIAPIGSGLIYQHLGGAMVWIVSGGIGVFCLLACWLASYANRQQQPTRG